VILASPLPGKAVSENAGKNCPIDWQLKDAADVGWFLLGCHGVARVGQGEGPAALFLAG